MNFYICHGRCSINILNMASLGRQWPHQPPRCLADASALFSLLLSLLPPLSPFSIPSSILSTPSSLFLSFSSLVFLSPLSSVLFPICYHIRSHSWCHLRIEVLLTSVWISRRTHTYIYIYICVHMLNTIFKIVGLLNSTDVATR